MSEPVDVRVTMRQEFEGVPREVGVIMRVVDIQEAGQSYRIFCIDGDEPVLKTVIPIDRVDRIELIAGQVCGAKSEMGIYTCDKESGHVGQPHSGKSDVGCVRFFWG